MKQPSIDKTAYVAPGAVVTGDVVLGAGSSVWYTAVLRGDSASITVGKNTNVQDGCVLHTDADHAVVVGDDVTIGHRAIVHGCTVKDGALIGMGAIVLNGAVVGKNALVAAGALVPQGMEIPDGMLAVGMPAKVRRPLTEEELLHNRQNAEEYVQLAACAKAEQEE